MNVKSRFNKAKMTIRKNAPTIGTIGTCAGVVATGVTAVIAGYKLYPKLEIHRAEMDKLRANKETFDDQKEYNKLVFEQYKQLAFEIVKTCWPVAVSATGTTGMAIAAHNTLQKRYLGAVSLYSAANAALLDYRGRVADKVGKDTEFELFTGTKKNEIVEVVTDKKGNEKNKVTTVAEPGITTDPNIILFDETSGYFRKGYPELSMLHVRSAEKDLTRALQAKGVVFLNEVYEAFDLPITPEGQLVGWVCDENNPNCDCAVDFGIDENSANYKDFMSGKNDFIYLTLNHDGLVYECFPQFITTRGRNYAGRI